ASECVGIEEHPEVRGDFRVRQRGAHQALDGPLVQVFCAPRVDDPAAVLAATALGAPRAEVDGAHGDDERSELAELVEELVQPVDTDTEVGSGLSSEVEQGGL